MAEEHDEPSHRQDEDEDSVDEVRPPILHEEDMLACGRGDEEEKTMQVCGHPKNHRAH